MLKRSRYFCYFVLEQTPAEEQFTDDLFLTQESSEGLLPSLMKIGVSRISMKDYELYYCDKDKLKVRYLVENPFD